MTYTVIRPLLFIILYFLLLDTCSTQPKRCVMGNDNNHLNKILFYLLF